MRESAIQQGFFFLRLNDPPHSFHHGDKLRFAQKNPFDMILFSHPLLFTIELKSTSGKSLTFYREDFIVEDRKQSYMIAKHQIEGLTRASVHEGVASDVFMTGAIAQLNIDTQTHKSYLVGGGGGMGKRFDQYELPFSTSFTAAEEWAQINEVNYGSAGKMSCVVGNEFYVVNTTTTLLNTNLVTGLVSTVSLPGTMSSITVPNAFVSFREKAFLFCYSGGMSNVMYDPKTNVFTTLSNIQGPYSAAIATKDNIIVLANGFTGYSTATSGNNYIYAFSEAGIQSILGSYARPLRASSVYSGVIGAAVQYIDGLLYWATSGYHTTFSSSATYTPKIFTFADGNTTALSTGIVPAFYQALGVSDYSCTAFGFEFDSKYYVVEKLNLYEYDFTTNTIVKSLATIPSRGYEHVSVYEDTLLCATESGLYQLPFNRGAPDESVGAVLEIYKGQQFRGEKELEIVDKFKITPQWQSADSDLEIKVGEYTSRGGYKVYVKSK